MYCASRFRSIWFDFCFLLHGIHGMHERGCASKLTSDQRYSQPPMISKVTTFFSVLDVREKNFRGE